MHETWRDWYEAVLRPLLDHTPDAEPSPTLKKLLARDPDEVDLALLAADTDRTQSYIFESAKLPEIRGGSELLRRLNQEVLPQIVTDAGLPAACVLYAGGGSLLALVPASIADDLAAQIERCYPDRTGTATITCVWRPVSPQEVLHGWGGTTFSQDQVNALRDRLTAEDWQRVARAYGLSDGGPIPPEAYRQRRGFGQMVQVMGTLLRRRKETPPAIPVVEAFPFAMRCQVCQVRPAERIAPYFGEDRPLCAACQRKAGDGRAQEARSQQVRRFLAWLKDRPDLEERYLGDAARRRVHFTQDLNELGAACRARPGYIGLLYADGNRMGQVLESLPTPEAYRQFSQALREALEHAAYQALAEHLHPIQIERVSPTGKPLGKGYIHPLEPLVAGGDDLILIVPADVALPIALRLSQLFEREMVQRVPDEIWSWLPPALRHPTLSVGVAIADSHNPVRVLQQLSRELCKSAKGRVHEEEEQGHPPTSALDFLVLKSQSMLRRDLRQLRRLPPYYYSEDGRRRGRLMTAAPYTLEEGRRLLRLLKAIRQANTPTSLLQNLVAALHRGRKYGSLHYLYQQARLGGTQPLLTLLPRVWPYDDRRDPIPWHRLPGEEEVFATIVPDLLDLYPFVPKPAPDDLWRAVLTEADDEDAN